jgi:hypothetical protein
VIGGGWGQIVWGGVVFLLRIQAHSMVRCSCACSLCNRTLCSRHHWHSTTNTLEPDTLYHPDALLSPCLCPTAVTLQVADALSLQFRLPPPGVPPPLPRASQEVLGGCPVVDALLLTSVWAVAVLRQLAQVSNTLPIDSTSAPCTPWFQNQRTAFRSSWLQCPAWILSATGQRAYRNSVCTLSPPFPPFSCAVLCCPVLSTQSGTYRGLVSLGVGAIGEAPVSGCSSSDSSRLGVIVTGMRGGVLMTEELLANGLPVDGISGSLVAGVPSSNPLAVPADPVSLRAGETVTLRGFVGFGVGWWGCGAVLAHVSLWHLHSSACPQTVATQTHTCF